VDLEAFCASKFLRTSASSPPTSIIRTMSSGVGIPWIISSAVKGSKKNAQAKLREVLSAVDNGSHVDTSKETVEQFAVRWMETYVATNCTIRTEIGYQGNIDRYIVPAGGGSGSAVYYQSWQQPV